MIWALSRRFTDPLLLPWGCGLVVTPLWLLWIQCAYLLVMCLAPPSSRAPMLNLIILLFNSVLWKWPDPHSHLKTRLLIIMHGDVNQRQPKQDDQCYKIHGEWIMILAMTRGIRKTRMKEKYFNRGSSDCNNSRSMADYLCLFYQVSWLELLQKVKSVRCSTL